MKYEIPEQRVVVTLGNGAEVACRPVPPYTMQYAIASVQEPDYPYVELRSRGGHAERRPALQGTEEYEQWKHAEAEYRKQLAEVIRVHSLTYGIVGWKFPGMDGFVTEPPDDWEVPIELTKLYGIETSDVPEQRRAQFIDIILIQTDKDDDLIMAAIGQSNKPLTNEEIMAAMRPFVSDG